MSNATLQAARLKHNKELNGIEIHFASKPERQILEDLKFNHFRWSKYSKCWYKKISAHALRIALQYGELPSTLDVDRITLDEENEQEGAYIEAALERNY